HLLGIGLDDGLADRHLPVAADDDAAALADGQDGRAVPEIGGGFSHAGVHADSCRSSGGPPPPLQTANRHCAPLPGSGAGMSRVTISASRSAAYRFPASLMWATSMK